MTAFCSLATTNCLLNTAQSREHHACMDKAFTWLHLQGLRAIPRQAVVCRWACSSACHQRCPFWLCAALDSRKEGRQTSAEIHKSSPQ